MASGTVKATKSNIYNIEFNHISSTVTTTDGEIVSVYLTISALNGYAIDLKFLDLRLKDVTNGVNPVITVKNTELTKIGTFLYMFPTSLRGSAGNPVPCNGGNISHEGNSDEIRISFFDFIASKPAGYIHAMR